METTIPKVIHYCWFGGNPLPELAEKCIASWHKYLPDFELKRWDESNFDVNIIPYTSEAYEAKKYAFVSDYARFWILYNYGGVYFDTDVEIIRSIDDIIAAGPFMGCENDYDPKARLNKSGLAPGLSLGVNPGLGLGVTPGLGLYAEILDKYKSFRFVKNDGTYNTKTVVSYTTELLCLRGLKNTREIQTVEGINIYPKSYFCPIDYETGEKDIRWNTRSIHHYAASWLSNKQKKLEFLKSIVGKKTYENTLKVLLPIVHCFRKFRQSK